MRALTPLGPATVPGLLYDLGRYPGLVPGDGLVHGELFAGADAAVLAALDQYEGCDPADEAGSLFRRERVEALGRGCTSTTATCGAAWIPGGDYRNWLKAS